MGQFVVILIGFLAAAPALADTASHASEYFNGTPTTFTQVTQHIQGQAVTAYKIVLGLHQMNSHASVQPSPIQLFLYIAVDASGFAADCRTWATQVTADQPKATGPYPYLEINLQMPNSATLSDEGNSIIPGDQVSCWEAMDFSPPR